MTLGPVAEAGSPAAVEVREPSAARRVVFAALYARSEARQATEDEPLKTKPVFAVGSKHLGLATDTLGALEHFSSEAVANSEAFFAPPVATTFEFREGLLTFDSSIESESADNDVVRAKYYPASAARGAFLLLSHWTSRRQDYSALVRVLNWFGFSCLHMSLPYHDERQSRSAGYAEELVSANLGLTLRANRQAVCDARACLQWLRGQGVKRIGVVGSSIGSSVATLVAAHDDSVNALCCLHMAEDFARVVLTGSATRHIAAALAGRVEPGPLEKIWSPISPLSYVDRLSQRLGKVLILSGDFDNVFLPQLTSDYVERLRCHGATVDWLRLGCGHYTLSSFPFNVRAVLAVRNWLDRS
jgi:hypothetical protein